MSLFQEENDEHYIALSNLLARPIGFDDVSAGPASSGSVSFSSSDSGSSTYRSSGSGETSPKSPSSRELQREYHESLYKTELCRTWEASHSCQYGIKCRFAHGQRELRPVVRHPKYKTQLCKTFREQGHCPYGPRCLFIHEDPSDLNATSLSTLSGKLQSLAIDRQAVNAPAYQPRGAYVPPYAAASSQQPPVANTTATVAAATPGLYQPPVPPAHALAPMSGSDDAVPFAPRKSRLQFFEVISQGQTATALSSPVPQQTGSGGM